jgi:hypothetical protein
MPDEFAGQAIDIAIPKFVQFFALEVEDVRAEDHRDVGTFAIENIAIHDRTPIEAELRAHRHRLATELKSINSPLDLSSSIKQLEEEIAVIEAGLTKLNTAAAA